MSRAHVDADRGRGYFSSVVFRIKARNMEAFVADSVADFEERTTRRLRDNFDHLRDASDDEVVGLIRRGRARAADVYGVRTPHAISLFIALMAHLGEDFDTSGAYPWAEEILAHEHLVGTARVDWLYDRAQQIEAAKRASAESEA